MPQAKPGRPPLSGSQSSGQSRSTGWKLDPIRNEAVHLIKLQFFYFIRMAPESDRPSAEERGDWQGRIQKALEEFAGLKPLQTALRNYLESHSHIKNNLDEFLTRIDAAEIGDPVKLIERISNKFEFTPISAYLPRNDVSLPTLLQLTGEERGWQHRGALHEWRLRLYHLEHLYSGERPTVLVIRNWHLKLDNLLRPMEQTKRQNLLRHASDLVRDWIRKRDGLAGYLKEWVQSRMKLSPKDDALIQADRDQSKIFPIKKMDDCEFVAFINGKFPWVQPDLRRAQPEYYRLRENRDFLATRIRIWYLFHRVPVGYRPKINVLKNWEILARHVTQDIDLVPIATLKSAVLAYCANEAHVNQHHQINLIELTDKIVADVRSYEIADPIPDWSDKTFNEFECHVKKVEKDLENYAEFEHANLKAFYLERRLTHESSLYAPAFQLWQKMRQRFLYENDPVQILSEYIESINETLVTAEYLYHGINVTAAEFVATSIESQRDSYHLEPRATHGLTHSSHLNSPALSLGKRAADPFIARQRARNEIIAKSQILL